MEIVIWVELASDVPLSGTVLDPVPEFEGSVFGLFGDSVVPVGEVLAGEPPLQRLTGGVWTLQASGRARA